MHQLRLTLEFTDPSGVTSQVERIVNADAAIASDRADELLEHLANDFDATLRVPGYRAALPAVGDLYSYTAARTPSSRSRNSPLSSTPGPSGWRSTPRT